MSSLNSWRNGTITLVSGKTVWAALCDFSGRSKGVSLYYKLKMVTKEPLREGTQIWCRMGFGEGVLFVEDLDPPNGFTMTGIVGGIQARVSFRIVDILDGGYVEICIELDNEAVLEESQLAFLREWMIDQINAIRRQAELAPKVR